METKEKEKEEEEELKINDMTIYDASCRNRLDIIQLFIDNIKDKYKNESIEIQNQYVIDYLNRKNKNNYDYSILNYAVYFGNIEIIKFLINMKVDINTTTKYNETPLHIACWKQQKLEIVKLLYKNGTNINAINEELQTSLHLACQFESNLEVIKFLCEKGLSINAVDEYGNTPLFYLIYNYINVNVEEDTLTEKEIILYLNDNYYLDLYHLNNEGDPVIYYITYDYIYSSYNIRKTSYSMDDYNDEYAHFLYIQDKIRKKLINKYESYHNKKNFIQFLNELGPLRVDDTLQPKHIIKHPVIEHTLFTGLQEYNRCIASYL